MGYPWLDPIAAALVALMIAKIGGELAWKSAKELVETAVSRRRTGYLSGRRWNRSKGPEMSITCGAVTWVRMLSSICTCRFTQTEHLGRAFHWLALPSLAH